MYGPTHVLKNPVKSLYHNWTWNQVNIVKKQQPVKFEDVPSFFMV